MSIRPMQEEDLPQVLSIEKASFSTPWGRWAFLAELKPPGYAFVYEERGRVLGYAVLRIVRDEGHLMNLTVAPQWRKRGIGSDLLRFCIEFCLHRGVTSLWLEVRESNEAAISLYQKMGFVTKGRRKGYYQDTGEDALLMELSLRKKTVQEAKVEAVRSMGPLCILELSLKEAVYYEPGQFVMIEAPGRPLMRPLSIFDLEGKTLKLLLRPVGAGTRTLVKVRTGETLRVLLPLGKGYPMPEGQKEAFLLAGGMGIASLFPLALKLSRKGIPVKLLWGARSSSWFPAPLLWQLTEGSVGLELVTEDGSMGKKGVVTEVLPKKWGTALIVYACGPKEMIKRILRIIPPHVKVYVSLEERMACGVGTCQACILSGRGGNKLVCRDGPVFEREEIGDPMS